MELNFSALTLSDLKEKQVVSSADGTILGHVSDIELDPTLGRVRAILIPSASGLFPFARREPLRIPIEQIERIGEDILLVGGALPKEKSKR